MNKKIKELQNQAFTECKNYEDDCGKNLVKTDEVFAKFAELIVRECLLCCDRTISDPVPESVDTFEQGGIHCMDEIKEHFGVEE
jgi:hypothetical protein